ncbi:MAG: 2-oxoglutarate dehydrogenase complex dihydrolipoyllysine-residue succinyltransferase [Pseudomonadales bacterium]|jgi:2-oxoglutarate dehydrogenase E2 component (dihydrolipoamide succinyltransferase)|nr:2-oxoglutarate dehydrogenase complex dihydrolipoyllysine-residue succinyltransferase [Pseudomonadales bacterium]MDP6473161.1 2-oxoglutarate dehydrogenase complex dihydrolipoyllysine-residue succinyltransferase [Pseudomonadales bacterium]MDP6826082.1 2-oxoglutarate dehydrogenase complex dihydrolipoyllysine-residue succinyltransferase [Pseudomonadales bacterium]MDP6970385.1 2-oxoglutarate dehydrogenase complex dihydrolipoyllysine-residue succinyltransferase [Pseudomonadales bacterium]|tara:strand:+ start:3165 stop:4430 length:1266 start_codon:yes stop_codon:yes gene_type:complete
MSMEIKAPAFPESISEGSVAVWHVAPGQPARRDELLVDIETDKVVLEVVAPVDGAIVEVLKPEGATVESEELLATFQPGEVGADAVPVRRAPATEEEVTDLTEPDDGVTGASPAARKLATEEGIDIAQVQGTGRGGRITKDDVTHYLIEERPARDHQAVRDRIQEPPPSPAPVAPTSGADLVPPNLGERVERRVPMTRLRASIARRLVEAQQTAAMLTTFNEVNMQPVMTLRRKYQEEFQARHNGTRLGFMSFFVRASVEALKRFPAVNASIDGNDIVYHGYYDIGVAVSTDRGLVVPVVRDADALGLAQIEDQIERYGTKAQDGKLTIEDMSGGTFTISNGGVFGSLLSTPILNPPQTAILGMHKIDERAMVVNGEVVVLPMMYLALSYDHRLIDGREAVRFLVAVKEMLEDPARILLEL